GFGLGQPRRESMSLQRLAGRTGMIGVLVALALVLAPGCVSPGFDPGLAWPPSQKVSVSPPPVEKPGPQPGAGLHQAAYNVSEQGESSGVCQAGYGLKRCAPSVCGGCGVCRTKCPPKYIHCFEGPPKLKFKRGCPKPVCDPCHLEHFGY